MSVVNKVILLGRLGKDPEARTVQNGMVVNFSVATSEVYKDKNTGERKEITEWHNVVLWNQPAEVASKYLHKGDMVYIEGKMRTRSWEKDGVTRYTTEVIGTNITLLGGNKSEGAPSQSSESKQELPKTNASKKEQDLFAATDDLPF